MPIEPGATHLIFFYNFLRCPSDAGRLLAQANESGPRQDCFSLNAHFLDYCMPIYSQSLVIGSG